MNKTLACFGLFSVTASAVFAEATFTNLMVRQKWPWSGNVSIDFVVNGTEGVDQQISVTAYNGEASFGKIPVAALTGDTVVNSDGRKHIEFDPTAAAAIKKIGVVSNFRVGLTATQTKSLYMIVDLAQEAPAVGRITYVTEDALTNGLWGSWVRNPYAANGVTNESVIWTGVAEDDLYRTNKLVFRRIDPGFFYRDYDATNGVQPSANQLVRLSKTFWMSVFEMTQGQCRSITGEWLGSFYTNALYRAGRPVEQVSYNELRGTTKGAQWPTGKDVDSDSLIDTFRQFTGLTGLDIPTTAEFEYACRAGTQTLCNNGLNTVTVPPGDTDTNMALVAWHRHGGTNNRDADLSEGPGKVGTLLPNSWGLYDMQGNVMEWCADWVWTDTDPTLPATDPVGPASGTQRQTQTGNLWWSAISQRPGNYLKPYVPSYNDNSSGFRLIYRP